MPTYEYHCKACGHRFERMQPMSEPPVRTCPKCAKRKVERLISSGGGLIFKGSGFYITDYRSQGYKDKAKAETEAARAPAAKSEEKPAGKEKAQDKAPESAAPTPAPKPAPKSPEPPKSPPRKPPRTAPAIDPVPRRR